MITAPLCARVRLLFPIVSPGGCLYVRPSLSPRTAEGYEQIIHHYLIPTFGNMVLTQPKARIYESFIHRN